MGVCHSVMYDYYTTLDVLLAERVEWSGEVNKLRGEIGDSIFQALLDYLVYPLGPRIRDTISHGVGSFLLIGLGGGGMATSLKITHETGSRSQRHIPSIV